MKGKLIIFSAPSGSGKTTIVKCLVSKGLNIEFSISATSREPRIGETDGIEYYFLSAEEFRKKIENKEFIEWEEVYKDHYYGTLKSEIERIWSGGNHVIFDVDVVGGLSLKKIFGDRSASFFVMAPSVNTLRERLLLRGTDAGDKIEMRIEKAEKEMERAPEFNYIIINDDLKKACDETEMIVKRFLKE